MQALVVEDSTTIRMILRQRLSKTGFKVVEASNGLEGLERLKEMDQITVAMVDWNMPKMSGIDFVRAVRMQRAYDALPLIMVATNTELEHIDTALEAVANEYIMKPFTPDMVREKLERRGLSKG